MFSCDKCGLCCRNIDRSMLYRDLNDGTGNCKFLDKETNLCKIYDTRPKKCNIDAMYEFFSKWMTYEDYIKLNIESCHILKMEALECKNNG